MSFNSYVSKKIIKIEGNEIQEVDSYVYLEQKISMDNNIMREINRKIRRGWSAFDRNNIILKNNMLLYLESLK